MDFLRVKKGVLVLVGLIVVIMGVVFYGQTPLVSDSVVHVRGPKLLSTVTAPMLTSTSHLVVFVDKEKKVFLLSEHNANKSLPLASVTKLMTALIATEHFDRTDMLELNAEILKTKGASGEYLVGDRLTITTALSALIIASHNEIATAFALHFGGIPAFVARMNKKAIELELTKTRYVNPSGVDPDGDNELGNESSAHDVFMLMRFLFENKLDLVATASLKELKIKTESGRDVALVNTDELLGSSIGRITVQAGKTGETPRAKQNLVVIASAPCEGVLYAVVLGSQNRSADMRALLTYADTAYRWDCE